MRHVLVPVLVVAAMLAAAACGGRDAAGSRLHVVTTTPLLADLAGRVAGEGVDVSAMIPLGTDLHSFEPAAAVARDVARADLLIVNGYNLEEGVLAVVVQNRGAGVPVVAAARGIEPLAGGPADEEDEDARAMPASADASGIDAEVFAEGDPHMWLSIPNAIRYVETIRDALSAVDPAGTEGYAGRAEALVGSFRALDVEVRAALEAVPAEDRRLVVFHDAFQYLAAEYGFELVGAVLPANPNQQSSAARIAEIIGTIRDLGVTSVYREPQFSAQTLEAIASETGVRVLTLRSTLDPDAPTYEALMRANAAALVEGARVGR